MSDMVKKLKAKLEGIAAKQAALIAAADEAGALTAEQQTEFDALQTEFDTTKSNLDRATKAADNAAAAAGVVVRSAPVVDVTGNIEQVTRGASVPAAPAEKLTTAQKIGIAAWGTVKAKHYSRKTALEHLDAEGLQQIADEFRATERKEIESVKRGFGTAAGSGGDNVIFTPLSTDFIEFLRNESMFMRGGPMPIDMSYGAIEIPGGNVGASATYTGEESNAGYTQATTRKVSMSAKHLRAITAMNNYAIEISPLAMAAIIGDDLQQAFILGMDNAGLRGDGTGSNPTGVRNLVNATHRYAATAATTATPTYAQIDTEAKGVLAKYRATNIPRRRPHWIMNYRTFTYMQFMRDGNGNFVYPGLQLANPVWYDNIPVLVSNGVPVNLGVGTDEGELYLVDFGHVLMGVARALKLTPSTEASYIDGTATLVSAFSKDQTLIRGTAAHDFDMRHDKAAVCVTGIKF